jgi:hypothetical protein
MEFEPIHGKRVLLGPPGIVGVKLPPELWQPYKRLHGKYQAYLADLPMLAVRDFDGKRTVKLTRKQLDALNVALAKALTAAEGSADSVFEAQEDARTRLFKRLQYLS